MTSFAEVVAVDDREMDLYLALPEARGPFPAIVVIQHAGGVDTFTSRYDGQTGLRWLCRCGAGSIPSFE